MRAIRRLTVRTVLPGPLAPLGVLAGNLRWAWHPETRAIFEFVDRDVDARGMDSGPTQKDEVVETAAA